MKVQNKDGGPERRIVTAMIVHNTVLARVASRWQKGGLFESEWANTVGQWCVDYYKSYTEAPGSNIQALFESWSSDSNDKDTVALVERFLSSLSEEYKRLKKEINPDHVLDEAGVFFNKVAVRQAIERAEGDLQKGDVSKALERISKFGRIELGSEEWVDALGDKEVMAQAFESKSEPLIKFKGALGEFFDDSLERDGFVALMAPEKRGKSYALQELGVVALTQGRNVAMFQVGDLSRNQAMRRLAIRFANRPLRACEVRIPTALDITDEPSLVTMHKTRTYDAALTSKEANRAILKFTKKYKAESKLRLSVHANSSISATGIESILDRWSSEGWNADVVIIDYADIMAPMNNLPESRDAINMTWKRLRRISQERHCLVLTATQTDADSYGADLIRRQNFSEDKRKFGQVTGMFALNQSDIEKRDGVMRLNWTVLREGEFVEGRVVYVAGCLGVANPFMLSCWPPVDFGLLQRRGRRGENG